MIGILFRADQGLDAAIQTANRTQRAKWQLLRRLPWSGGRTMYWLVAAR